MDGTGGTDGTGGADGTGGGDAGGSGGGGGNGGDGADCPLPAQDSLTWSLTTLEGDTLPPAEPADGAGEPPVELSIQGRIVSSSVGAITLDVCPPDADCVPSLTTLTLAARGLPDVLVPEGVLVELRFQSQHGTNGYTDFTAMHFTLENLPEWGGLSNPVAADDRIWLAAHDRFVTGGPNALTAAFDPFLVERLDVCFSTHAGNPVYAMQLSMPGSAPSSVTLGAGEDAAIHVTGAHGGDYVFRNLRSFEYLHPSHEFAYWLAYAGAP
ncbi:hypothetical protein WMF30_26695 [Sorangium sp. So ce134]